MGRKGLDATNHNLVFSESIHCYEYGWDMGRYTLFELRESSSSWTDCVEVFSSSVSAAAETISSILCARTKNGKNEPFRNRPWRLDFIVSRRPAACDVTGQLWWLIGISPTGFDSSSIQRLCYHGNANWVWLRRHFFHLIINGIINSSSSNSSRQQQRQNWLNW